MIARLIQFFEQAEPTEYVVVAFLLVTAGVVVALVGAIILHPNG